MRVCSGFPVRVASALLALAAATGVGAASLTASQVSEAQVKAAFLLNFTRFVEWPATFTGPLTICVAADDAFVDSVRQSVRGQSAAGHELRARQLHPGDSPENCQVGSSVFPIPCRSPNNCGRSGDRC